MSKFDNLLTWFFHCITRSAKVRIINVFAIVSILFYQIYKFIFQLALDQSIKQTHRSSSSRPKIQNFARIYNPAVTFISERISKGQFTLHLPKKHSRARHAGIIDEPSYRAATDQPFAASTRSYIYPIPTNANIIPPHLFSSPPSSFHFSEEGCISITHPRSSSSFFPVVFFLLAHFSRRIHFDGKTRRPSNIGGNGLHSLGLSSRAILSPGR